MIRSEEIFKIFLGSLLSDARLSISDSTLLRLSVKMFRGGLSDGMNLCFLSTVYLFPRRGFANECHLQSQSQLHHCCVLIYMKCFILVGALIQSLSWDRHEAGIYCRSS